MRLEERVTSALQSQTESLPPVRTDLPAIRSAARAQSRRRAAVGLLCAVALAAAVVATGVTDLGRDRAAQVPGGSSSASPTPQASEADDLTGPMDTTNWKPYTSAVYGFDLRRPLGWTVDPADRRWRPGADLEDNLTPGYDTFRAAAGDVGVGIWSAPLEPGTSIETTADIVAWVEDYCRAEGNTPCTGIRQRAVPLCLEKWDCHPGLLVPFAYDVQAFFSGGIYDADAMTVVAVWRGETDSSVVRFGGSQRLLEGFLSTMQVWPASTPRNERR